MKIAVLSDTRLPTHADFPGHGLGKMARIQAEGLKARGHDVTLYAAPYSAWDGALVTATDEQRFCAMDFSAYDVILDNTHAHLLQQAQPHLKILNVSHDREGHPGRCAIYPSEAHRYFYKGKVGRVIQNAVDVPETMPIYERGDYFAFMGTMYKEKAPVWAANAARLAGVKLAMAGTTPPVYPPLKNVQYVGTYTGADKDAFFGRAKALIFPATTEAGGLTILEAQAQGTPVIVSWWGGAQNYIVNNVTGFIVRDTLELVEAIGKVDTLKREDCYNHVKTYHVKSEYVRFIEKALSDVIAGEVW